MFFGFIVFIILVATVGAVAYWHYLRIFREAKNYERGLKMVPLLIHLPPSSDDIESGSRDSRDVAEESISKAETLYNIIASTSRKGIKSKLYGQRHIAFEIVAIRGTIRYYVAVPVTLVSVVEQAILSAYPTAQLEEVEEHNIFSPVGKISGTIGGELVLKEHFAKSIATFRDLKRDSMQAIINVLSALGKEDGASIQILLRPAQEGWEKKALSVSSKMRKNKGSSSTSKFAVSGFAKDLVSAPFKPPESSESKPQEKELTHLEQSNIEAIEEKTKHVAYEVLIRIVASSNVSTNAQKILNNIVAVFSLFDSAGKNGFKFNLARDVESFVTAYILRFFPQQLNKNILNSVELATIFHLPDQKSTPTSQLERQASKQVDGPSNMADDGLLLGYNVFRGVKKEIRLSDDDRRRHMYIVGQTGTGKSVLLENLALQDILDGKGFAFIDPHGDAVERLMSMVPKERTEDVIYFSPADTDSPLGLNLFEFNSPDQKDFLIQEAINMLYKLYDPQRQGIIGPRYEHWFRNAALTLMSDPQGSTFIDIPKVFTDNQYAKQKLRYVTDHTVLDFWNKEMAKTSDYHKSEILGWFVSKFGAFLSNEMMRNIIGQTKSAFNLREVMDESKILLVNLSKGRTGELNSKLLGMLFVMKFQAAAMSRADVPEDQRPDFSLYVDEFQNFSTDSFATILSEARKYHLNLVVANQFIGQLTEEIRDAVFGNVGSVISLRTGANDADFLVKQFAPIFDSEDLVKLPNFQGVVRLMVGGVPSQPFSINTLPPLGTPNPRLGKALKSLSAAKYGRPKSIVEKEIMERMRSEILAKPPTANTQRGFPATGPGGAPTGQRAVGQTPSSFGQNPLSSGGKSFLDDWLEKRKQQAASPTATQQLSQKTTSSSSDITSKPIDAQLTDNIPVNPTEQKVSASNQPLINKVDNNQPATPPAPSINASTSSHEPPGQGSNKIGSNVSSQVKDKQDVADIASELKKKIQKDKDNKKLSDDDEEAVSALIKKSKTASIDHSQVETSPDSPFSIYIDKDGNLHYNLEKESPPVPKNQQATTDKTEKSGQ